MTRKDYVLIAAVFAEAAGSFENPTPDRRTSEELRASRIAVRATAERMADRLEADNPRFDRARFLEACGAEWAGK